MPRLEEMFGLADADYGPGYTRRKRMPTMTAKDFMNLPTVDLLGWWIYHEAGGGELGKEKIAATQPEEYAKIIAAYDALGREGVASIMGEAKYPLDEDMETKVIRCQDAKAILTKMKNNSDARLFHAEFVKRSDNSLRHMTCRFGVTKYLKGGEAAYDEKEKDVIIVWDVNAAPRYTKEEKEKIERGEMQERSAGGYRAISLENLIAMNIAGKRYIIAENKDKVVL